MKPGKVRNIDLTLTLLVCAVALVIDAGAAKSQRSGFEMSGLRLGMSLDVFRRDRPTAKIVRKVPVRYCFGTPVAMHTLTRFEAIVETGGSELEINFGRGTGRDRITSIRWKTIATEDPSRIAHVRDRLMRRYGPPDRTLVPHKMEPAGLIVGFEWSRPPDAFLRVTLRRDHERDPDRVYLTMYLTDTLPGPPTVRRVSRRYRETLAAFYKKCWVRGRRPPSKITTLSATSRDDGIPF